MLLKLDSFSLSAVAVCTFSDSHMENFNLVQEFVKIKSWLLLIFSTCYAGVTLTGLLHIFFDSYSANTPNINVTTLKINLII